MKTVWFVSHYSMPPEYEMRIKTQMYAKYLQKKEYNIKMFSASTIHNTNINLITNGEKYIERTYEGLEFVHIKCSDYKGNGLSRIRNMFQFTSRFFKIGSSFPLPDVIVADTSCIQYYSIYKFCKKNNIKLIIEIRDLWPYCIEEYLDYSHNNPIIKYLYYREKKMYERANAVIFAMEGGIQYITDKKWDISNGGRVNLNKLYYINNGVDNFDFREKVDKYLYNDNDFNDSTFKVVYTGSIRLAYNIGNIVKAAEVLKQRGYENAITFFIFGEGADKDKFVSYCERQKLHNIVFKGFVEKKSIPNILSKSDLCLLSMESANTFKYGPSQNKLFEYLAAGKPILLTTEISYNVVTRFKAGLVVENNTGEGIADLILKFYAMSVDERKQIGENAKQCALNFDYEILSERLKDIIDCI